MAGQHPFWLLLIGLVALAVLVWLNLMLARRFRRYLNVGIAVAGVIVVVTTLVAAVAAWRADSQNDDLLQNELQIAVDQAAARTAGNDAKAYESLRLILQGSGPTYEPLWEAAAAVVDDRADRHGAGRVERVRRRPPADRRPRRQRPLVRREEDRHRRRG